MVTSRKVICVQKSLEIKKINFLLLIYGYPKRILIFSRRRNIPLKKENGFIPTEGKGSHVWRKKCQIHIFIFKCAMVYHKRFVSLFQMFP